MREAVAFSLCEYCDETAIPLLLEALDSEREQTAKEAERKLDRWFPLRFYGKGPGQTRDWDEVTRRWHAWWEENREHITEYYTLVVRPGDEFSSIVGNMYHGDHPPGWESYSKRHAAIVAANPDIDPANLVEGQTLIIPRLKTLDPDDYEGD